jgi:hypothetical protein
MMPVKDALINKCMVAMPLWRREQIAESPIMRFAEAYLMMADIKYRPGAPGDGMGHVSLSPDEYKDQDRLQSEAVQYAVKFYQEDNRQEFHTGCTNYTTCGAMVFIIEAARQLCTGDDGNQCAARLLSMAITEIECAGIKSAKQ